ncbi:MAG TPA: DegQ family serine endoprotease [Stellaceae bacterium]|nr:DegQ family serine endoprotease [Stellaceae bacterium]
MTQTDANRRPWWKGRRSAALAAGLAATLALSPLVWAETDSSQSSANTSIPTPQISQQSFAPLVKKVLPAVVNISVTEKPTADDQMSDQSFDTSPGDNNSPFDEFLRRFFEQHGGNGQSVPREFGGHPNDQEGVKRIALGSGFIIDPAGYIVTNNHVVGQAAKVQVILQDGTKYTAKITGRDPRTDLAVLKIDADKPLPSVSFGDSNAAQIGDWVVAVGNPFGLGGSVTTGIISARGRDIHEGQFDDFLQIDAPINRGNSGGPTFNLQGQVIGINTAIYSPNGGSVGIGFAIPSNIASKVVSELREHGKVQRGWLGVQIQEVTPAIAASLGLKGEEGALVAVVTANSAAAKAGLKQGDVVLSFNGNEIKKLRDLSRFVAATAPGSTSNMVVWRNGERMTLPVTVGEAPANPQVASANSEPRQSEKASSTVALGMHFAPLTSELRRELHVGHDVSGVVITGVDSGSLADNLGLGRGDVVQAINQQPVKTPHEAAEKLKGIADSNHKTALLLLNRHGITQYVGISVDKEHG